MKVNKPTPISTEKTAADQGVPQSAFNSGWSVDSPTKPGLQATPKLINEQDSLDAMATMEISGVQKQTIKENLADALGINSKNADKERIEVLGVELIRKQNQIAVLEAANQHLLEQEKKENDEDLFLGKKRLNDCLKLFTKIENTAPEVMKIKEEMVEIKTEQFRFRELFSELVMRPDLNSVLNGMKKEMNLLINDSQRKFEYTYNKDFD